MTTKTNIQTLYYVDYIINKDVNGNITETYYELKRTKDNAILYANSDIRQVYAELFLNHIIYSDVTFL